MDKHRAAEKCGQASCCCTITVVWNACVCVWASIVLLKDHCCLECVDKHRAAEGSLLFGVCGQASCRWRVTVVWSVCTSIVLLKDRCCLVCVDKHRAAEGSLLFGVHEARHSAAEESLLFGVCVQASCCRRIICPCSKRSLFTRMIVTHSCDKTGWYY